MWLFCLESVLQPCQGLKPSMAVLGLCFLMLTRAQDLALS